MRSFHDLITEHLAEYVGPHQEILRHAPALYRLQANLLRDPGLPGRMRPLLLASIAYFALPEDIVSEDLRGAAGLLDDIFLSAFTVDAIRQAAGSHEILEHNWDGDVPVAELIGRILEQEKELIGDQLEIILWFIGYEHLPH